MGLVAGFVACEKDKEFELTKLEVLNESFLTTDSSAVLSCQLKTNATISEAYVHYSINSDFTDYSVAKMISKDGGHSAELRDLQDTTEYYVRYEATNVYSSVINDAWSSFKTKKCITIPIVSTTSASQVMESTATVGGSINSNGGAEVKECGVVYSMSEEPTIADYKVTCSAVMDSYQLNLTWLQAGVNYYVRAYAINEKGVGYGETVVFTTKSVSVSAPSGTENGYDYVDLGLSVKWATMNVGATKPENFGAYYAWGELEGNKKSYSWGNYKYATMNENNVITLLKYNSSNNYGAVDNKTNLDLEDDVAHSQWGGRWRMPTRDELEELLECEWIWTEYNGVSGCVIRSKTNNNSIFMPATGYIEDETRYNKGTNVGIFSSTLYTTNPLRAYGVAMNFSTKQLDIFFFLRYNGDAIRGVVGEEILQIELPTITTTTATQITTNSAVAGGNVTSDGNASVTERGVCIATVSNPTTSNTKVTAGSGTGSFTCNLTGMQANTTYYVRAYAINSKGTAYGEEVSFTTNEQSSTPNVGTENSHEYVDLGLSVKWATCNVGANAPEEYGDYFAWGETTTKSTYNWSTYKYCNGSSSTLTKYNNSSSYGSVDNKTQLELSDDAAAVNWGGNWRMPTKAEQDELRNNCTWTWTTQNGVNGYKVTGANGNSIFLPAAGCRNGGSLNGAGSYGYYWSGSLGTDNPSGAYSLDFLSSDVGWYYYDRYYGQSVRPVCP